MKYVVAVIPPSALEAVQAALEAAEVYRLTISEVEVPVLGQDAPPGGLPQGLRLEIAVNDAFLAPTLAAFASAEEVAGEAGVHFQVQVSILPLEDSVRIRTGERGPEAI